jgi:hypothetical protein
MFHRNLLICVLTQTWQQTPGHEGARGGLRFDGIRALRAQGAEGRIVQKLGRRYLARCDAAEWGRVHDFP